MKLVPYDRNKIDNVNFVKTKNYKLLLEFVESNELCARVDDHDCAKASYCAASLQASIKRFNINNVRVMLRKDKVFLIRTDK